MFSKKSANSSRSKQLSQARSKLLSGHSSNSSCGLGTPSRIGGAGIQSAFPGTIGSAHLSNSYGSAPLKELAYDDNSERDVLMNESEDHEERFLIPLSVNQEAPSSSSSSSSSFRSRVTSLFFGGGPEASTNNNDDEEGEDAIMNSSPCNKTRPKTAPLSDAAATSSSALFSAGTVRRSQIRIGNAEEEERDEMEMECTLPSRPKSAPPAATLTMGSAFSSMGSMLGGLSIAAAGISGSARQHTAGPHIGTASSSSSSSPAPPSLAVTRQYRSIFQSGIFLCIHSYVLLFHTLFSFIYVSRRHLDSQS